MTDTRFPERWLNDRRLQRLSHEAFRLHVFGLMWAVANRLDGHLPEDDVAHVALLVRVDAANVHELKKAELWDREPGGWLIRDFEATQTSALELAAQDAARVRERDKKRRQRAAKRDASPGTSRGTVPGTALGQGQGQGSPTEELTEGGLPLGARPLRVLRSDAWPEVADIPS
jgi:hypothetical protein